MTASKHNLVTACSMKCHLLFQKSDLLLLQSSTHTPEILKTLLRMQRENRYCDFKLVTPYKTINVHKLIILANSPSFLLNHGSLHNTEELHFPEILPTVLDSVVYFLYTGKLKVKKSEISLMKSFCEKEGLKSALELLNDYSDVESLSLTVEQLMESTNCHSKLTFEEESANTSLHISGQKAEAATDIIKELEAETEKECSFVTKSGRVSKPTSLKVATVLAEKKKNKMRSLMSEIKSKEQMLKIQKSKNFRSKGTDLKRKLLSRHSAYIRQVRTMPSRINNYSANRDFTESQNTYSDLIESQDCSELKAIGLSEGYDPYHFHNYALSNADSSDAADDDGNDENENGDNSEKYDDDRYESEINGEKEINSDEDSKEKDVKKQTQRRKKQKESVLYQCPECDKVMHHKRLLQKHMAEVHQDKDGMESYKNTTCMLCGKILTNFKTLARHLINKHQDKDPKNIRLVKKKLVADVDLSYNVLQIVFDMKSDAMVCKTKPD